MEKILTVVVPTYNTEKYIEECLESMAGEAVRNDLEVLIVNDGSTDRSAELAGQFARRYPETFRVIHKENGGHGSTINRGIKEASGTYFKVVDSDDRLVPETLEKLIGWLKEEHSDIVATNHCWFDNSTAREKEEFVHPFEDVVYGKEYQFSDITKRFIIKMHGMTIRTEILKEHMPPIDEHCFYVDMEYILFPMPYVKTITFYQDVVYMYRIGLPGQSVSIERMRRNAENYDRVLTRMLAFYKEQQKENAPAHVMRYLENALGGMAASRFKIYLSFGYSQSIKKEMVAFDQMLKREYPGIYHAVTNKAVLALRASGYLLYLPAHLAFWLQERRK